MQSQQQPLTKAEKILEARRRRKEQKASLNALTQEQKQSIEGELEGGKHAYAGLTEQTIFTDKSADYIAGYQKGFKKKLESMSQSDVDFKTGWRLGSLDIASNMPQRIFTNQSPDFIKGYTAGRGNTTFVAVVTAVPRQNNVTTDFEKGKKLGRSAALKGRNFPDTQFRKEDFIKGLREGYDEVRTLMTESEFNYKKGYYRGMQQRVRGVNVPREYYDTPHFETMYPFVITDPSFFAGLKDGQEGANKSLSKFFDETEQDSGLDDETLDHPVTPALVEANSYQAPIPIIVEDKGNENLTYQNNPHLFLKPAAVFRGRLSAKESSAEKESEKDSRSLSPKRRG